MPNSISKKILEKIPIEKRKKCQNCSGHLSSTIFYYEHSGGWYVKEFKKKVWIWIECSKCGEEWALKYLGVPTSVVF